MIDALIKRVSVTYKCYEMYAHRGGGGGGRCNCSCFEVDQEMDAILLIIGIVYGVCNLSILQKTINKTSKCPHAFAMCSIRTDLLKQENEEIDSL